MLNFKKESSIVLRKIESNRTKRGVSLYLAITIMAILFAIGLGLSTIIFRQIRMVKGMGDSVIALYAADTGIERAMYALYIENVSLPFEYSGYFDWNNNEAQDSEEPTYHVKGYAPGANCSASFYCLKSIGTYQKTKRAIEAFY